MTDFFNPFWADTPAPKNDFMPQPDRAVPSPSALPQVRLTEPQTPRDAGLTDPVRLVRAVEERMRREGTLVDGECRLYRPANDRRGTPRRCA